MPRSLALMRALQNNGVPVFALTNFGVGSFAVAEVHYPFLKAFDRLYVSGRMKVAKPDSAIYAGVEADCGIAPGRLLFTDDPGREYRGSAGQRLADASVHRAGWSGGSVGWRGAAECAGNAGI